MANLYIDLTNGTDGGGGTVHDGLMEDNSGSNYAAIASTDNTHTYIAQGALDNDGDDEYNGDYIYNVTRSLGALISDYDGDDEGGNSVITHAEIVGNVDTDEFYIIRAIKTIGYYTSTLVRSAGDIAYVRANTTQTIAADVVFDENGDKDDFIYIIGCDATTNDPWGDASDTKPTIDCNGGSYSIYPDGDDYWKFTRLIFTNSTDPLGVVYPNNVQGTYLDSCDITESTTGVYVREGEVYLKDCTLVDVGIGINGSRGSHFYLEGCEIDRDDGTLTRGVMMLDQSKAVLVDCNIGASNSPTTDDIYVDENGVCLLRNVTYDDTNLNVGEQGYIYSEDDNGVLGAHASHQGAGTTAKETTTVRSGGSSSSIDMTPNANCGANLPLKSSGYWHVLQHWPDATWNEWCTAAEHTLTVYIRAKGTWGTYPTASELYFQASYISDAGAAGARTKINSTAVLSHASNWVAFAVTFTPTQAGFVYGNVFLHLYEDAGDGCYIDAGIVKT